MKLFTFFSMAMIKNSRTGFAFVLFFFAVTLSQSLLAQNVSGNEPVQWVGRPNGYSTTPYNSDYRTTSYRKLSTSASNPTDGRGQWSTTINVQTSGADITPDNMPGGTGAGWLLISGPASDRFQSKWNFTGISQASLNSVNEVTLQAGGDDMGLNMQTAGYYTFTMRDAGYLNTQCYVGYTENLPVIVSRTSETINNSTNGTILSITTSSTPSAGENLYVRYRTGTNDFSSGTTVIQAFGSGTSFSVEIPAQPCGTNVYYYVYSSTRSFAQIVVDSESDRALAALRYDDNAGSNYTYLANTALVTASAGANGSLIPAGTTSHICGEDVVYTITPNECYSVQDVFVDGVSQGSINTYTFTNISGEHTIIASFALSTFTINASAGTGGSISPNGASTAICGDDITYTITPDPCFSISGVIVDGIPVGSLSSFSFNNVTANHSIVASFSPIPFTIFVTQGNNGNISPGSGTVNCGTDATYMITANPCFQVADVIVDGLSVGAVSSYTFTNVQTTHSITASFTIINYTITASAGANGSVTPSGASIVNCGTNNVYTIVPDLCYHIEDVLVDGVSQGAITTYSFANTNADHTISASFTLNAALTAPVISGPVNVCQFVGTTVPVTYTVVSPGAANFNWVLPPNVVLISSTPNSITVTINANFAGQANRQIRVNALSPCGNSAISIYYLQVQAPVTPGAITGNGNVCEVIGTTNSNQYSISPVPGATSYNWAALSGSAVIFHPNGLGINDTIVTITFTVGFSNVALTVQAVNNCGISSKRSLSLYRVIPSTPSLISGPTNVCANIGLGAIPATYSTNSIPGVSYNWTVPAGSTALTGQGTSSISFIYPSGFTSGTISVVAANGCGISTPRSLNVNRLLPSAASGITAVEIQGCPDRIVRYSIASIPSNATSVLWTVPIIGAIIITGQGTASIDVSYPTTAGTGVVAATGTSNCGNSSVRSLFVSLTDCGIGPPPPPGPRAGKGEPVFSAAEKISVNVYPNPTVNDFKLQVVTAGKQPIKVRLMDARGRLFRNFEALPYQCINVGAELKAGTYLLEVKQGSEVKVTRLIKF